MHSTGCDADRGVHQGGGQDEALHHGEGAGHHGVRLCQGASSIALSEHDYVMADIKKEVSDCEENGNQMEARAEEDNEDEDTEDEEEEEEEDIDEYEDEEEELEGGKERWFNLSQLAEVRNTVLLSLKVLEPLLRRTYHHPDSFSLVVSAKVLFYIG